MLHFPARGASWALPFATRSPRIHGDSTTNKESMMFPPSLRMMCSAFLDLPQDQLATQLQEQKYRARKPPRVQNSSVIGSGFSPKLEYSLDLLDKPGTRLHRATYAALLRVCGSTKTLSIGKRIHDHLLKSGNERNLFYDNLLVQMYGDCGSMRDARVQFAKMRKRDVFSWNFMIKACTRQGLGAEALHLFSQMQGEAMMPDPFILASLCSASASEIAVVEGKRLHARVTGCGFERDTVLGTALVSMYGKCGFVDDARNMFDRMPKRDVFSWTAMIEAYCQDGLGKEALNLFDQMDREGIIPDRFILVSVVSACASQATLAEGREMHARIKDRGFESDIIVGNALVNMYGKCSSLQDALKVFERMTEKDLVSWNAMIAVYNQNAQHKCALELFEQMQQKGVKPDRVTFVSIFDSCASLGAVAKGREIHICIIDSEFESDVVVGTAIVNMYGKCGSPEDALQTFKKLSKQDVISWNALIAAYAQNGQGKDALQTFYQMQNEGLVPDKVTYVSLLSACSHAGLLDEACRYFGAMTKDHGVTPIAEHYNCIVDILGRVGRLHEADNLISKMSVHPTAASWLTLLGACRNQIDVERGEHAAKQLFELEPENAAPYIMLSNIYAGVDRGKDAAKVIELMRSKGIVIK